MCRLWFALLLPVTLLADPPRARQEVVKDSYHGVMVSDPYRWLEDAGSKDVVAWSAAQNQHTRDLLAKLPALESVRGQLKKILSAKTFRYYSLVRAGGKVFAMKRQPPKQQPFLVVLPSVTEPEKARVLLDPMVLDPKGNTSIDWFVPSPDGKLVAVSLSKAGSEAGDVSIHDAVTGKQVHEVISRVQNGTAGGDLIWSADSTGFYYTRYPRGKERPAEDLDFYQQLYYHTLGTSTESDRYELGKDLPRIAEIKGTLHAPTGRLLVTVQNGDGGEFAFYLREAAGTWRKLADFADRLVQGTFVPDGGILAVSRKDAPRGKILALSARDPELARATVLIPEGKDSIVTDFWSKPTVLPTATRLYVLYQLGGPSEVRAFTLDGKLSTAPRQLPISTVGDLTALEGDDLVFANESYVQPLGQYLFRARTGETTRLPLTSPPTVSFADITVERAFATSKDGTRVPVNILAPKGTPRDGSAPCLVTGYGGYGVNIQPAFHADRRVLFDRGFVWAQANLRGGGEFGETWHKAGSLTNKQNVFDDFASVVKYLIAEKYTSSARLGIVGGSNGGLLMGATLTQHPDLMKVVISYVGIYDMLRVELSANGAFNVPEFGSVKDSEQFSALLAYSPYHNVKKGTRYPATLFLTGAKDPRVDPLQSRKMTARLQASTASKAPILLRTSETAGHGLSTALSERIEELADVYAFLFDQLGVK